ncbi:MAG: hypothetical protein U0641_05740 [Anaerolineae bacterium]
MIKHHVSVNLDYDHFRSTTATPLPYLLQTIGERLKDYEVDQAQHVQEGIMLQASTTLTLWSGGKATLTTWDTENSFIFSGEELESFDEGDV